MTMALSKDMKIVMLYNAFITALIVIAGISAHHKTIKNWVWTLFAIWVLQMLLVMIHCAVIFCSFLYSFFKSRKVSFKVCVTCGLTILATVVINILAFIVDNLVATSLFSLLNKVGLL